MMTEPSAASKFGVQLKSGDIPNSPPVDKQTKNVDRAKASVYSWDDPRLQKTAVVQKRITKAAVMVQRFIRACISHWQYYNEERIPLLEELEDIKRRRLEELEEVVQFKKRGYEQARFELDAEYNMSKEMLDKISKTSKQIKKEIQDEKDAGIDLEKGILEENQRSKKLSREEHEIKAQHTMSRLDIEVPALEEEKEELQEANDEFGSVVRALQAQLNDMNLQLGLEQKHKKRLVDTLTRMLKELLARGANKGKVVDPVKASIQQAYELFNPKIEPPPAPAPAPKAGTKPQKQQQQQQGAAAAPNNNNNKADDDDDDNSTSSSSDGSTSTSSSDSEGEEQGGRKATARTRADMGLRASTGTSLMKSSSIQNSKSKSSDDLRASTGAASSLGKKAPAHIVRGNSGGGHNNNGIGKAANKAKIRKSKSVDMSNGGAFDWSDKDKVRRASLAVPGLKESSSSSHHNKKKDKKRASQRSKSPTRRSQSADLDALAKKAKAAKEAKKQKAKAEESFDWSALQSALGVDPASFNWSALGVTGLDDKSSKSQKKEKKEKKSKKSKDKHKDKDKDKDKSSKKKKKEKESSKESSKISNFKWG